MWMALATPDHFLPSPNLTCVFSAGTSRASSAAVASPRARKARNVSFSALSSHSIGSVVMPPCSMRSSHRFRSRAAIARVLLACTIGTRSTGTTCTVRAHAEHPDHRTLLVQLVLDRLDRRIVDTRGKAEEHRGRICRVHGDEVAHRRRHVCRSVRSDRGDDGARAGRDVARR